jgi:hypothetical protein
MPTGGSRFTARQETRWFGSCSRLRQACKPRENSRLRWFGSARSVCCNERLGMIARCPALTPIEPRRTYLLGRFAAGPSVHSASHSRATSSAFTPVLRHALLRTQRLELRDGLRVQLRALRLSRRCARRRRRAGGSCASVAPKALPVGAVEDRAVGLGFAAARAAHRRGSLRTHSHLGKPPRRAMREQRAAHGRPPTHARAHQCAHSHQQARAQSSTVTQGVLVAKGTARRMRRAMRACSTKQDLEP